MPSAAIALPPPIREGDRLDSGEFLRRWEAMPDLKHAELIGGIVFFLPSPVSLLHSDAHREMVRWLLSYDEHARGCQAGIDCTWKMGPEDAPQPDLFLRILPEYGGQSRVEPPYPAGAPELIVEVSGSSLSRDLGIKLELYRSVGVREYLNVVLQPRQIVWRKLTRGRYREIKTDRDGLLRSRLFPGLWLDPAALEPETFRPVRPSKKASARRSTPLLFAACPRGCASSPSPPFGRGSVWAFVRMRETGAPPPRQVFPAWLPVRRTR